MPGMSIPVEIIEEAAAAIHGTYGQQDTGRSQRIAEAVLSAVWPDIQMHLLRGHADLLIAKYGVTNRAASDLRRKAELIAQQGH